MNNDIITDILELAIKNHPMQGVLVDEAAVQACKDYWTAVLEADEQDRD